MQSAASSTPEPRQQPEPSGSVAPFWILVAALVVFAAYTANFLYFFVDDEGISFVYAQHLLRGHGMVYNTIEGPTEGYSNFLHVVLDTALLAGVRALAWPKISVFFLGKGVSLLAGFGTILLTFLTIRRMREVDHPGLAAGLVVLATSGPLAVWSSSSLDTVPFTFLLTLLVFALVCGERSVRPARFDGLALVAAVLVSLERIDGPIFVAAVAGAWVIFAPRARQRTLLVRVILPAILLTSLYHLWRVWYFGEWLNMPAYTKVYYKLGKHPNTLIKDPIRQYWRGFAYVYGYPAIAVVTLGAVWAAFRNAAIRPTLLASIAILLYVATVGDWMFGFRFFVAAFPLLSVLAAQAASIVFRDRPQLGWAMAVTAALWCGQRAAAFERVYERTERQVSWLRHPSLSTAHYFGRYYEVLQRSSAYVHLGARVAYNQSGFLPFMLDLENIDELGICSRFYAQLPTRDVFFTEVGRYAPLTPKPIVEGTEAYLLHRDVQFVIQGVKLLRGANSGRVPEQLMGGYYTLVDTIEGSEAIYRRTERDASEYKREPRLFTENLAHAANVRQASLDGQPVPYRDIPHSFDFLEGSTKLIGFTSQYTLDVQFGDTDLDVSEVAVSEAQATDPVSVIFELQSATGEVRHATRLDLTPKVTRQLLVRLPEPVRASRLHVTVLGPPVRTTVSFSDVRILGQTPKLSAYIRRTLTFFENESPVVSRKDK